MKNATLSDLLMGIEHILVKEVRLLDNLNAANIYRPALQSHHDAILRFLAQLFPKGAPFADELRVADTDHDSYANATRALLQAHVLAPSTPPDLRAAANRLTSELLPTGAALNVTYVEQAQAARPRRDQLPTYADDLRRFPTADGATLLDWFTAHLDAADRILHLLQARIEALANHQDLLALNASPDASKLRNATVKTLGRFRKTLRDEAAQRADLPPSIEARLFGMLDLLVEKRG